MKLRQFIEENRDKIDIYIELDAALSLLSGNKGHYIYSDLTPEELDDVREEFIYNDDSLRELAIEEGVDL